MNSKCQMQKWRVYATNESFKRRKLKTQCQLSLLVMGKAVCRGYSLAEAVSSGVTAHLRLILWKP